MLSSICEVPSSNHWQTPAQGMLVNSHGRVLLNTSYIMMKDYVLLLGDSQN